MAGKICERRVEESRHGEVRCRSKTSGWMLYGEDITHAVAEDMVRFKEGKCESS